MSSPTNSRVARFGIFEIDLAAGELRKNGMKLRLQGQPLQVLVTLLERPGEVVTREELRQKLWPSDTFVDFDHSLNTAVNKVREALGDSASSPRYIETLARRGYRFLGTIEPARNNEIPAMQAESVRLIADRPALHPELEVPIPHRGITRSLFALIQIMYALFYISALIRIRGVQGVAEWLLPHGGASLLVAMVMVTAGIGIPLRCYLISAVAFDYRRLDEKFRRIFPFVFALDQLWAIAPFLLVRQIGMGSAFAACAALLYVPFSERTLIRLAYPGQ